MANHEMTYKPKSRFGYWMDERLPLMRMMHGQFVDFPTPRNLNYLWTFGGILMFCLAVQIVTGIVLAMHYVPNEKMAFDSVEHIRRNVNYGWLIRNVHAVGASFFFIAVYIHMARGMYYGSYKGPREILWILGVIIYLLMMATGFLGYTLPWGQMSFWGVTVITNLFSSLDAVIPGLGTKIVTWLWGGYAVSGATLNRFFSLHYLLPFVIAGVVALHVWALHVVGQNNPTGIEIKSKSDSVPMAPYAIMKDLFAMSVFVLVFCWFVFFAPDYLGHADNYIEANPLVTPPHIVPEWYYLPFYAILRAIPSKLGGVLAMFGSILILLFIPWLDTSRVRSARYRPMFKWFLVLFFISVIALGYLGAKPPEGWYVIYSRIFTLYYFAFFLLIMPIVGVIETPSSMPRSITESASAEALALCLPVLPPPPRSAEGPELNHDPFLRYQNFRRCCARPLLASPLAPSFAAGEAPEIKRHGWSFSGPRGKFDKAQLQRGFQVYQEVCAACHGLKRVYFRNLAEAGGPGFPEEAVKALAAAWPNQIFDGPNDAGEIADRRGRIIKRPAKASDPILGPYDNEKAAAAANNGAVPPDLSLITKARGVEYHGSLLAHPFMMLRDMVNGYQEGGADYTYAILTGYGNTPANMKLADGMHYNKAFPGNQIAMIQPMQDGQVKYQDAATPRTVAQYAEDVTAFLMWTGDPRLEERKGMGLSVLIYLLITSLLLYFAKKRLWASVH